MPYVITEADVDPKFAARAVEHYEETGEPLLDYLHVDYSIVLEANTEWSEPGQYEMTNPAIDPEPKMTWRELAGRGDQTLEQLTKGFSLEPQQLDELVPAEYFSEYSLGVEVDGRKSAFRILDGLIPGEWYDERPDDEEAPLGYVEIWDGPTPGSEYQAITVSSAVALSCLQRYLDQIDSGIKLVL